MLSTFLVLIPRSEELGPVSVGWDEPGPAGSACVLGELSLQADLLSALLSLGSGQAGGL